MKTLSNIYSREKTLFYFTMWNDSDRKGYKEYINHNVVNNLFIVKPQGEKGSVWYDMDELNLINLKIKEKIKNDSLFINNLRDRLDTEWKILFPYLSKQKVIESGDELEKYYISLVSWWSAMNTAFSIPDMDDVDVEIKKIFLSYRTESEKYTEQMNKVFINFWTSYYPEHLDILFFISPKEAITFSKGELSNNQLQEIQKRTNGCFMLNEKIYLINELDSILIQSSLSLEKVITEEVKEIKGQVGYKTDKLIIGIVRVISGFKNMGEFKTGEILVTEMTNPDYLPIMRIAAAIVTDEGGITCHAAIASRELKIPCIIGTKIATKVLKNSDIIEINTNNGIIRTVK